MTVDTSTNQERTEPNLEDAVASGSIDILNGSDDDDLYSLLAKLDAQRTVCVDQSRHLAVSVIESLAWVYSMRLDGGNRTTPFFPFQRSAQGGPSPAPEHLSPGQIGLFADLVPAITSPPRRARLADLVCLLGRERRHEYAVIAIDAYTARPISNETWHLGEDQHWHRAMVLALKFRGAAGSRADDIERHLFAAFEEAAKRSQGTEALWYLQPLVSEGSPAYSNAIARQLQQLAETRAVTGNWRGAEDFFEAAATWYGWDKKPERVAEMMVRRAETTEGKADASASAIVRQSFFTDALRHYRAVNGRFNAQFGVNSAMERIKAKMEAAGLLALGEMETFTSSPIDISDLVQHAIDQVSGKDAVSALKTFFGLDRYPCPANFRKQAEEAAKGSIFGSLGDSNYMASGGRVVERVEALKGDAAADDAAFQLKAIQEYIQYAKLVAEGSLIPALAQIYVEHALTLGDFLLIARGSPVVPVDHAHVIAKGLHAGFQRDFTVALHLLLPHFEHMVRTILKSHGAITTTTDRDGFTMEVGLSALLDKPEMLPVFGDKVTFAIRSLMCSQVGPNFRNDIAHGLSTGSHCNSPLGLYTWWLVFKIIFTSWYLSQEPDGAQDTPAAAPGDRNDESEDGRSD